MYNRSGNHRNDETNAVFVVRVRVRPKGDGRRNRNAADTGTAAEGKEGAKGSKNRNQSNRILEIVNFFPSVRSSE